MFTIEKSQVNLKVSDRTRNRMKIQLKFSADQALVLKNFFMALKGIKDNEFRETEFNDFLKGALFKGIESFQEELISNAKKMAKENPEIRKKFEEMGAQFDAEGNMISEEEPVMTPIPMTPEEVPSTTTPTVNNLES